MQRMRQASPAPDCEFEREFHRLGLAYVAGLDEVGRGCLAGPVAAGAVILPNSPAPQLFEVVRDSKRLSAKQRGEAYEMITRSAVSHAVGWVAPAEIDDIGIVPATRRAMRRALAKLRPAPDALLIDALTLPSVNLPQKAIIRGDGKSLSIAAASIVAKVERDRLMSELAQEYEDYGFERHKGYGTARHLDAIRRQGPTPIHRMSFRPLIDLTARTARADRATAGRWAEGFVADALESRGMQVIARNFSGRYGEIDVIALSGRTLAFVEVRARSSTAFATQAETITRAKSKRLVATCYQFLRQTDVEWADWRIDVAAVALDEWNRPTSVEFIESAVEDW